VELCILHIFEDYLSIPSILVSGARLLMLHVNIYRVAVMKQPLLCLYICIIISYMYELMFSGASLRSHVTVQVSSSVSLRSWCMTQTTRTESARLISLQTSFHKLLSHCCSVSQVSCPYELMLHCPMFLMAEIFPLDLGWILCTNWTRMHLMLQAEVQLLNN